MTDIVKTLILAARRAATDWQNHLYGKAATEITSLRAERDALREWQDRAFKAHPNLDLDVERIGDDHAG